eukprot:GHUV01018868.1.p1 GENE.GHUV01018868.1~~GHUV01018868.1.p1  ORF type:complete len:119 (+),score=30.32 GHUV01018868.1:924-1280(+)
MGPAALIINHLLLVLLLLPQAHQDTVEVLSAVADRLRAAPRPFFFRDQPDCLLTNRLLVLLLLLLIGSMHFLNVLFPQAPGYDNTLAAAAATGLPRCRRGAISCCRPAQSITGALLLW